MLTLLAKEDGEVVEGRGKGRPALQIEWCLDGKRCFIEKRESTRIEVVGTLTTLLSRIR